MGIEEKKVKILHRLEIFNEGKLELIDDTISPDYLYHLPTDELKGPEGFKQLVG